MAGGGTGRDGLAFLVSGFRRMFFEGRGGGVKYNADRMIVGQNFMLALFVLEIEHQPGDSGIGCLELADTHLLYG